MSYLYSNLFFTSFMLLGFLQSARICFFHHRYELSAELGLIIYIRSPVYRSLN